MFWKGKDMFCLEDKPATNCSFFCEKTWSNFFRYQPSPINGENISRLGGLCLLWPILSLKLWRGNQKIWHWKIRKIWVSGFNVFNFAGGFHWRFRSVILKNAGIFPVISWSADELRIPPSQTWKLKLSDWDLCGRSALRKTCPNCQLAFARSSRVFRLDLCWTLFEVARKKRWLWKAVN